MYNICSVRSNGHALFVGTFRPTLVYHLARKKKRTINATETSENMNVLSPPFRSCQSDYP